MKKMVVRTIEEKLLEKGHVKGHVRNVKGKTVRVKDYWTRYNKRDFPQTKPERQEILPQRDSAHPNVEFWLTPKSKEIYEMLEANFPKEVRFDKKKRYIFFPPHLRGEVEETLSDFGVEYDVIRDSVIQFMDGTIEENVPEYKASKLTLGGEVEKFWEPKFEMQIEHPDFDDPDEPEKTIAILDYHADIDSDERGEFIDLDDYELAWSDSHKKLTHEEWKKYINRIVPGFKSTTYGDDIEERIIEHIKDNMDRPLRIANPYAGMVIGPGDKIGYRR